VTTYYKTLIEKISPRSNSFWTPPSPLFLPIHFEAIIIIHSTTVIKTGQNLIDHLKENNDAFNQNV